MHQNLAYKASEMASRLAQKVHKKYYLQNLFIHAILAKDS
jgi:hypothetical protein